MKIYILQLKNPNMDGSDSAFDEIQTFGNMNDLLLEFANKFSYYENHSDIHSFEYPSMDSSTNEVHGMFVFLNKDGSKTSARVCDCDVECD